MISLLFSILLTSQASLRINGVETDVFRAGRPTSFEMQILNPNNGKPYHHFMPMHEKLMHWIVVKEDLTRYAHVHPKLSHHSMSFKITLNQSSTDPDDIHIENIFDEPGRYFIFAESMPMDPDFEGMLYHRFEVYAIGPELPVTPKDEIGVEEKYFTKDLKAGRRGDYFRVRFEWENFQLCSVWVPKFYFQVDVLGEDGKYRAPKKFEDWLGMGAHAVLLGYDAEDVEEKIFYHLHGFHPMAVAGEFTLPMHDHNNQLPDGDYKIWGQFKLNGQILTFPFSFEYRRPRERAHSQDSTMCMW